MDLPCAYCGTFDKVHQHHIRHIRKRAYSLIDGNTPYKKILALRNRRQIPLCEECHLKLVHPGKYTGPQFIKLAPEKTIDNRIVHIETSVKPGKEYFSKSLEERGWTQIQKTNPNPRVRRKNPQVGNLPLTEKRLPTNIQNPNPRVRRRNP